MPGAKDKGEPGEETTNGCRGFLGTVLELNCDDVYLTKFAKCYEKEDVSHIIHTVNQLYHNKGCFYRVLIN